MFTKLRQDLVRHYAVMAMNPHTVDYARQRVKDLQKDSSGLWNGIALEIKEKIDELKKQV